MLPSGYALSWFAPTVLDSDPVKGFDLFSSVSSAAYSTEMEVSNTGVTIRRAGGQSIFNITAPPITTNYMTVAAGGAGQPIHALHSPERPDGIVLTLGVYAAMCLAASGQTEQKPLAIVERGRLAMKVGDGRGGVIDLSPEEVVLIRQNVGAGANAVAAAQLYDALGSP